jgi:hypothetical protein
MNQPVSFLKKSVYLYNNNIVLRHFWKVFDSAWFANLYQKWNFYRLVGIDEVCHVFVFGLSWKKHLITVKKIEKEVCPFCIILYRIKGNLTSPVKVLNDIHLTFVLKFSNRPLVGSTSNAWAQKQESPTQDRPTQENRQTSWSNKCSSATKAGVWGQIQDATNAGVVNIS